MKLQIISTSPLMGREESKMEKKKEVGFKRDRKKHGLTHHQLYRTWDNMMSRCYNPKHNSYKNYGAKGVVVSEEFRDCKTYIEYIMSLPGYGSAPNLSIDRIIGEKGYTRGNLRWATRRAQEMNKKRLYKYGSPGIRPLKGKWSSYIKYNKKYITVGLFKTKEEAIIARNEYINKEKIPNS